MNDCILTFITALILSTLGQVLMNQSIRIISINTHSDERIGVASLAIDCTAVLITKDKTKRNSGLYLASDYNICIKI